MRRRRTYEWDVVDIVERRIPHSTDVECMKRVELYKWKEFDPSIFNRSEHPIQPGDVDLLLCKHEADERFTPLHAIEAKVFYFHNNKLNNAYYAGIDQALALLNFGFDFVSLFHCFILSLEDVAQEKQLDNYFGYSKRIRKLIRSSGIPIGYTAFFTFSSGDSINKESERVETVDNISNPDELKIEPKRNQIDEDNLIIREIILNKLNITDDESKIQSGLLR
jgi:hypothetical protein